MYDKPIFYDSDCLVCFLVVNQCNILKKLFSKVIVPLDVKEEIFNPATPDLIKKNFNKLLETGFVEIKEIGIGTEKFDFYEDIRNSHFKKDKISIGDGEAAVITLSYFNNGVIASNNLSDIMDYVKKYNLKLITTAFILARAYEKNIKTLDELDEIWFNMLNNGRKRSLPNFKSFSQYYSKQYNKDLKFMGF